MNSTPDRNGLDITPFTIESLESSAKITYPKHRASFDKKQHSDLFELQLELMARLREQAHVFALKLLPPVAQKNLGLALWSDGDSKRDTYLCLCCLLDGDVKKTEQTDFEKHEKAVEHWKKKHMKCNLRVLTNGIEEMTLKMFGAENEDTLDGIGDKLIEALTNFTEDSESSK